MCGELLATHFACKPFKKLTPEQGRTMMVWDGASIRLRTNVIPIGEFLTANEYSMLQKPCRSFRYLNFIEYV